MLSIRSNDNVDWCVKSASARFYQSSKNIVPTGSCCNYDSLFNFWLAEKVLKVWILIDVKL